jgi:hypothetical protein
VLQKEQEVAEQAVFLQSMQDARCELGDMVQAQLRHLELGSHEIGESSSVALISLMDCATPTHRPIF